MNERSASILVVEDNPLAGKMVRVALEAEGYDVHLAQDGRTALELMDQVSPDLVIQDLKLPDMDGIELATKVRERAAGRQLPIIALSGFQPELSYARAARAAFAEYLVKPVEPSALVRVVRAHLRPEEHATQRPGAGRQLLIVDDDPVQLRLAKTHFEALGFAVDTAANGIEGLEAARRNIPVAILSDVLMPRLDGFRFCAEVKRDPRLSSVPVILVSTSFTNEADAELALQAGAEVLITRTPDHQDLIDALLATLGQPAPPHRVELSTDPFTARISRQLEHQVRINERLAQRLARAHAELAVLSAAAQSVAGSGTSGPALSDVLQQSLNAAGISRGAVYLFGTDGTPELHAQLGDESAGPPSRADEFPGSDLIREATAVPTVIPASRLGNGTTQPVLMTGIRLGDELLGAWWMELGREQSAADWSPFAAALGAQFSAVIALSRAFAQAAGGNEVARLQELSRQQIQIRDQFLSYVSQELRTALAAIHESAAIVLNGLAGEIGPDARRHLDVVLRHANELRSMIDGLLAATRADAARSSPTGGHWPPGEHHCR